MSIKTNNLFDKDNAVLLDLYPTQTGLVADGLVEGNNSHSLLIPISPGKYRFSIFHPQGSLVRNRHRIASYSEYPVAGMEALSWSETSKRECGSLSVTFTVPNGAKYILLFLWTGEEYTVDVINRVIAHNNIIVRDVGTLEEIEWDNIGERFYETGIDKCVLYPIKSGRYRSGVAWNGVSAINESSSGAEANSVYADNRKYLNIMSDEELKLTIEAYDYPDEFLDCLGQKEVSDGLTIFQQKRNHFGLCYRTILGNDTDGTECAYKIHVVFDCLASPSDRSYATINESPEAMSFSWEVSTTPAKIEDGKPSADMIFDSYKLGNSGLMNVLRALERILYGTSETAPTFLKPSDIYDVFESEMYMRDSDNDTILDNLGEKLITSVFD